MIIGINHVTLSVRDLEKSLEFYREVLGFRVAARWGKGAYLLAGDLWVALLVDPSARESSLPEYTHVAFSVSMENFDAIVERIRTSGARIWRENESEGPSLYFEDPNGHKLEVHVGTLESRIRSVNENPVSGWTVDFDE
jgi:catechol 2,3-dioxygenase-like lactoylglutathione lyase family enzyme